LISTRIGYTHNEQPPAFASSPTAGFADRSPVQLIVVASIYAKRIKSVKYFNGVHYGDWASAAQKAAFLFSRSRSQTINIWWPDVASFRFQADGSQPISSERVF
jgi:hypothetical protein